jgi:hypothetical protein
MNEKVYNRTIISMLHDGIWQDRLFIADIRKNTEDKTNKIKIVKTNSFD